MIIIITVITAVCLFLFMPRRYYIPKHILAMNDNTAEDGVKHYTEYKVHFDYTKVYADKDGNLVFVLTKEQRKSFLEYVKDDMEYCEYVLAEYNMELSYNASYTEVIVKCKSEDFGEVIDADSLTGMAASAGFYQGFIGVKPEDNKVTLKVIDTDTNEVIYEKTLEAP